MNSSVPSRLGYNGRLYEALYRGDDWVIRGVRSGYGVDVSGHRPDDLRVVDRFLDEEFRKRVMQTHRTYVTVVVWVGGYVGEVFIRNLGGRWHFPNILELIGLLSPVNSLPRLQRYCYVACGNERIRVLEAAREAIDKTAKVFSLSQFYKDRAQVIRPA